MTVRRRLARAALTAVTAVVVTATAAGCTLAVGDSGDPPSTTADVPLPPGASFGASPAPTDSTTCDTASLRPLGELPEPGQMPPGSTMDRIVKRGRLVVGTDLGSNPLSFRDPLSGDVKGFDVDIARWIAEALFGDPGRIDYRMVSTNDRIDALRDGTVDLVIKSMSINCNRLESVDFSVPYFAATQRILAFQHSGIDGPADLANKTVCAARASTSIGRVVRITPTARFVTTKSWADCLVMMQQGQVDAITSDTPILAGIAEQDPWVRVVGESLGSENYGVGITKGRSDFVRFVNGVLERRRADGSWQRSYQTWLSTLGPGSPPPFTYRD